MEITDDDVGAWFRTRDDSYVIIVGYSVEHSPMYPCHGVEVSETGWLTETYTRDGRYMNTEKRSLCDLVERVTDVVKIAKLELMYAQTNS